MKMKTNFLAVLFLATLALTTSPAFGQEVSADKRAEIEKILDTTGALKLGQQFATAFAAQIANALRASHANVPQKALEVLPEEVNAVIADNIASFKELVIQIYDRHFTLEDLKGLNQFYSTDIGRKLVSVLPSLTQESMSAGQKWGQALGPEIERRIEARFKKENIVL
jgi:uncharacterized protein